MPSSDYTSAGGGLKLKGAKPTGVDKKRKKSKKDKSASEAQSTTLEEQNSSVPAGAAHEIVETKSVAQYDDEAEVRGDRSRSVASREPETRGKTEAELRHEEMKRKRLDERLKREGVKTHKEKVEQLNKYLSTLSEHHDMPKIGPG